MAILASITDALASLQAQTAAAQPLANAAGATKTALKLNAAALVDDIQATLTAASDLDTYVAPVDAPTIVSDIDALAEMATDQATLSFMRGVIGRAASNLDQV